MTQMLEVVSTHPITQAEKVVWLNTEHIGGVEPCDDNPDASHIMLVNGGVIHVRGKAATIADQMATYGRSKITLPLYDVNADNLKPGKTDEELHRDIQREKVSYVTADKW